MAFNNVGFPEDTTTNEGLKEAIKVVTNRMYEFMMAQLIVNDDKPETMVQYIKTMQALDIDQEDMIDQILLVASRLAIVLVTYAIKMQYESKNRVYPNHVLSEYRLREMKIDRE